MRSATRRILLLTSLAAVSYGVFNVIMHWSLDFPYLDWPFPFGTHYQEITPHPDGEGMIIRTSSHPIGAAYEDPFWVVWSSVLYGGIATAATTLFIRPTPNAQNI